MPKQPLSFPLRAGRFAAAGALVFAAFVAYHNSFSVPFLYDDVPAIAGNPTIQQLWPVWPALSPPAHLTTSGRPLVNLSLAINYAVGQTDVWGYHAVNLAIHVLAALTLFGVVRRTLLQPPLQARFGAAALPLALTIAAIWTLHPLQTESVTYVVQRAESLVGLFYLLTLYCFIRGIEEGASRLWFPAAVFFCFAGVGTKEVMVSAPLVVLLYDRTFVSGSFRAAWLKRRMLYLALVTSWLLLGYLVMSTGGTRDGSAGFGQGMAWWSYALTQAKAIVLYLGLSLWPRALVFDYGNAVVPVSEALPFAAMVALLVAGTVLALRRWPAVGFAGFCFFALLAPSSSVVPVVTETMAEHRMYLPLASVIAVVVLGCYLRLGRSSLPLLLTSAVGLGFLTVRRNDVYQSHLSLWSDTVVKMPGNPRAHNQLGSALAAAGREQEAMIHYEEALRLSPGDSKALFNVATALFRQGRLEESAHHFAETLRRDPNHVDAHNNYGPVLMRLGRREEAVHHYREALRLEPRYAPAHNNLGIALGAAGQLGEAIAHFQAALREKPDYPEACNNLGYALRQAGRTLEAVAYFRAALELVPNYAEAHNNLAKALEALGWTSESVAHYREVLRLEPAYADGHYNLGRALLHLGRKAEASAAFEATLRVAPDHAEARRQLIILRDAPAATVSTEGSTP